MASLNRPARLNRVLLALTGVVLLAVAAFVLLLAFGPLAQWLPVFAAEAPLLPARASVPWWATCLVILAAVVIGLASVRWLLAQALRRPPTRSWRLPTDTRRGVTELDTDHAADAVAADISAYPGVDKATATLTGPRAQPELHLVVHTERGTDIGPLRERISSHALPRLRAALELDALPTDLLLRLDTTTPTSRTR